MKTALFTKLLAERSLTEAIEIAGEIGYDGVEPMGREPHLPPDTSLDRARELRAMLDEHGLEVPCLATYTGGYVDVSDDEREAELADLERYLELADALDCDLVRHGVGGPPVREAAESDFQVAASWLGRGSRPPVARRARPHGRPPDPARTPPPGSPIPWPRGPVGRRHRV